MNDSLSFSEVRIGLLLPDKAREAVSQILSRFKKNIEETTPDSTWHLNLLSLPSQKVTEDQLEAIRVPLPLPFFLTISLTHIGRALSADQLWAYAAPTYPMREIYALLQKRAKSVGIEMIHNDLPTFVPHIELAHIKPGLTTMLADEIVAITFSARELVLFGNKHMGSKAQEHIALGVLPLTP